MIPNEVIDLLELVKIADDDEIFGDNLLKDDLGQLCVEIAAVWLAREYLARKETKA